jgi:sodium--glutamate symport carrier gltS
MVQLAHGVKFRNPAWYSGCFSIRYGECDLGLIIGGVIGGPLAKLLINRYSLAQPKPMLKSKIVTHILNKIQMI